VDTPAPVKISPVDTILLLIRPAMGVACRKHIENHCRRD